MSFAAPIPQRRVPAPVHGPVTVGSGGLRQCDNCSREENPAAGRLLSVCAGCKFTAYCSRECQRQNWDAHKGVCRLTMATVGASRHQVNGTGPGNYPTPNMAKYLRKFCATHASMLAWAVFQALDLFHNGSNIHRQALLIELGYEANAPFRFVIKGTYDVPRSYLSQYADPLIVEDVNRREERSKRGGGIGCAIVILQCGAMAEVMPVEIDDPSRMGAWEVREDWDEVMEWYIQAGRADFTPPLSTAVTVRNHRY